MEMLEAIGLVALIAFFISVAFLCVGIFMLVFLEEWREFKRKYYQ